jgi:hypothetical protein
MRYPRCFIVLSREIPETVAEQLWTIYEGGKVYIPSICKQSPNLNKQIKIIRKIDEEFERRFQTHSIVIFGKQIDSFTLMILSKYDPKFYWVDSKRNFNAIEECCKNFDDYSQMLSHLRIAEQFYFDAYQRIKNLSPETVFRDEYIENILQWSCWQNKSNAESATRAWIRSQLKTGILNRLDL